jgi:DNA-binding NarL/FixJ family response regulator|nr:MAG TPA: response regulator [Caudoviricetes sp.]
MKLSELTKPELDRIQENANFTEEEERIFKLLSRNFSQKEIAVRICMSQRTLERRMRNIKNKIERVCRDWN